MDKLDTKVILEKYRAGEPLSDQEKLWLESFYLHTAKSSRYDISDADLEQNLAKVDGVLQQKMSNGHSRMSLVWLYAAASILVIATVGIFLPISSSKDTVEEQRAQLESIRPGTDKATLELANGELMELNGQNGLEIDANTFLVDGNTIDLAARGIASSAMNTLRIPRGGQYKVVLSDGSIVWLNAGSQLRYPTTFAGNRREVELHGEAYFEVSHNPQKPFFVRTAEQQIKVLGTGFNVSAYERTPATTTLAHGKVEISHTNRPTSPLLLSPGEQAYMANSAIRRKKVDVNTIIAWKEGLFSFKRSNLKEITQQLERWYDVDFVFKNPTIPSKEITGEISRQVSLYDVVEILSYFDIHCAIDGRIVYLDVKK